MDSPLRQLVFVIVLVAAAGGASAAAAEVTGLRLSEKEKVAVELFRCDDRLCGRIAWMAEPYGDEGLKRDTENPDPAARDRPWCGLSVITDLERAGADRWDDGAFYYPKHGRSYDLKLQRVDDRLRMRAFLGLELLGRTETWTRPDESLPGCPASS